MTTRKVTSRKDLASGKWVKLVELEYSIDQKIHNKWEMLERTTKPSNGLDGVDVLGIICTDSPKIVLVSQFRPPLDAFCLELPAGLITDSAEDPIAAGMRELREETGYFGCEGEIIPDLLFLDPGVSNCNMKFVKIKINPEDPRNVNPQPQFQDEEDITCHLLPFNSNLYDELVLLCKANTYVLDARLGSLALGMKLVNKFN